MPLPKFFQISELQLFDAKKKKELTTCTRARMMDFHEIALASHVQPRRGVQMLELSLLVCSIYLAPFYCTSALALSSRTFEIPAGFNQPSICRNMRDLLVVDLSAYLFDNGLEHLYAHGRCISDTREVKWLGSSLHLRLA